MSANLLKEDEQLYIAQMERTNGAAMFNSAIVVKLIDRLCEARAEKYEFAAQQLDNLAKDCEMQHMQWRAIKAMRDKAAELRRLANG